jgi:hypothetical protein
MGLFPFVYRKQKSVTNRNRNADEPTAKGERSLPRTAPAEAQKISAFLWGEVARAIRRDANPIEINDWIETALSRPEIPNEVRRYIVNGINGIKRSPHRPKSTYEQRTMAAIELVERVERLTVEFGAAGAKQPQQAAFSKLANGKNKGTIERKYRAALELLRAWPDFVEWHSRLRYPGGKVADFSA